MQELVVDSFAGGGGASTGIEAAIGRPVDIAINHDPVALALYKVNHPGTHLYCESVWDVDPRKAAAGRPVGLCWLSPDCKHFSKAKGGRPVEKHIRGLAWVAVRWAATVKPRVIILENVEEFTTWGPLIPKTDPKTGQMLKIIPPPEENDDGGIYICISEPGEFVPYEQRFIIPDPKRKGQTFKAFKNALQRQGYQVDHRELKACDFGAPTIRKRFFLVARCDGQPIVWPEPTHGNPESAAVKSGKLLPWRTAAEIIDWSLPCPSIFERKRPLAENTMKRIARGIKKFVIDNPKPFIIQVNHTGSGDTFRGQDVDEPMQTITAKNGWGIVEPFLVGAGGPVYAGKPVPIDVPLGTELTENHRALVTPFIARIGQTGFGEDRLQYQVIDPLTTIVGKAEHLLIAPTLIQTGYGEREGQAPRAPGLHKPLGTVVAGGSKHALVTALIARQFGNSTGHSMGEPLGTVTAGGGGKSQLVAAFLSKYHGPKSDSEVRGQMPGEPLKTLDTSNRFSLVSAFLAKHYGGGYEGYGSDLEHPTPTVTTVDHNALVTSHLLKLRGTCQHGQPVDESAPTVTAGGLHIGEVRAFLLKYYGTAVGQSCNEPLHTVTTRDRLGLVTVQGVDYQIVDIGMRMLKPRELFRAQGFLDTYIIEHDVDGKRFPQDVQVKMCGNSVPPDMAEALVQANLPDLCGMPERTVAQG